VSGRVNHKSSLRFYENGKLFTFDLADETGSVRVTAFNALADKFFDIIEVSELMRYILYLHILST
jgi:replication factor A1